MIASSCVAHAAIMVQRQGILRKSQQHVVTRLRALGHALEQTGVTLRVCRGQRQQVVHAGQRAHHGGYAQTRRNTRVPLVPPKPNEFDRATSTGVWRAVCGTKSRSQPSPGLSRLIVGGATLSRIASTQKIASIPPAAPSRCPVIDLVELTITVFACSPNEALTAWVSARSPT